MSGLFGVVSHGKSCASDLFYGTDYHSHLGTENGGLAVWCNGGITKKIHNLSEAPFQYKFLPDLHRLHGRMGIGVISDLDAQPLAHSSHLGIYAIATSGLISNIRRLRNKYEKKGFEFPVSNRGAINETELIATIIALEKNFAAGIQRVFAEIQGSCSMLLLTQAGIIAVRDRLGRHSLALAHKDGAIAVASETCSFQNQGFRFDRFLGPGEGVILRPDLAIEPLLPPGKIVKFCPFYWIYTGNNASQYERPDLWVELVRERSGQKLAQRAPQIPADFVTGIPESGTAHAIGYQLGSQIPYREAIFKYNETYGRSYLPGDPKIRTRVASHKLFIVSDLIKGQRLIVCDDSIVRGTQTIKFFARLWSAGAKKIYFKLGFPAIFYSCPYIRSTRSTQGLAVRQAISQLGEKEIAPFIDRSSSAYAEMQAKVAKIFNVDSVQYQLPEDLVTIIGLPEESLCRYCWLGIEG